MKPGAFGRVLVAWLLLCAQPAHAQVGPPPPFGINAPTTVTPSGVLPLDVSPELGLAVSGGEVEGWDWSPTESLHWVFRITGIEKRNDDATWSIAYSNYSIYTGSLAGRDHQGAGTLGDDGLMYSTVEAYSSCATFSLQEIVQWNLNGTVSKVIDVSGQGIEASGVTVASGTAYVTSYCTPGIIQKYRVSDGAYLGSITMSQSVANSQGGKYYNGALLISGVLSGKYGLFSVDPTAGTTTQLYTYTNITSNIEGVGTRSGKVGVALLSTINGVSYNRVLFAGISGVATTTQPVTAWSNGNVSVGSSGVGATPTSRLQVDGSLIVGQQFQGQAAPSDGLAVQGFVSIGSLNSRAQMDMGCLNVAAGCGMTMLTSNAGSTYFGLTDTSWGIGSNKFIWGSGTTLASANVKMTFDFSANNLGIGTTSPASKLEVNGGMRLSTATAQPSCTSTIRGTFWAVAAASGTKDSVQVCAKDASDAYAWRTIY